MIIISYVFEMLSHLPPYGIIWTCGSMQIDEKNSLDIFEMN
jgi:hypothetical protein